jgi:hypothetical protein
LVHWWLGVHCRTAVLEISGSNTVFRLFLKQFVDNFIEFRAPGRQSRIHQGAIELSLTSSQPPTQTRTAHYPLKLLITSHLHSTIYHPFGIYKHCMLYPQNTLNLTANLSQAMKSDEYGSLSHVNMNTTQLASEQRLINRADIFVNKKKERSSQGISNENSV